MDFSKLPRNPRSPRKTLTLLLSASSAIAVLILLLFPSRSPPKFSIVIDAGSTGTRIHVFGYKTRPGSATPFEIDLGSTAEMKVRPGLSAFAGDPGRAGESLRELVEFGRERVGRGNLGETEIRLMATAGLRMVGDGVKERILESCRGVLRGSGFRFRDDWASVISGSDEGIFAWVAANYALGTLGGDPLETTGIMELGGASAQVTFVSSEPLPSEYAHVVKFGENTYSLYSNSFLHFGQNVAYHSVQELLSLRSLESSTESTQGEMFIDPCSPKGYSHNSISFNNSAGVLSPKVAHASGNFSGCRSAAFTLLQREKEQCAYQTCHLGSIFMPKLQGKFLATENFFYTSEFFELGSTPMLSDFMSAGQQFCGADLLDLKKKYHSLDDEDFPRYCFSSAYIVALLHDSFGMSLEDDRISFVNQIGNFQLDWALGAFIMQRLSNPTRDHSDWIYLLRENSVTALSIVLLSALLIFAAWSVLRWRKPQTKTVYDLEKGRYIITRVNR
ncbi:uncharacterized protein A4U43_C07F35310 [Asparagus officinalis]|uniref:Apyrase 6 n=1 Tax=Asparagus officinalis TaxID=4686 RepID=A0A5P1EMI8_ASPOF|nr:probable apyrase 6 isoform X2 [Asparagus officinalis]ONK65260.1 uncharacterized protein A4U43_C07F35310 [Asparagus officinalis]